MIAFAYFALFAWPLVVWRLFGRLPPSAAAIWSLLGAYLLLPQGLAVDLPVLPPYDRNMAAVLPTLLLLGGAGVAWAKRNSGRGLDLGGWIPRSALIRTLIALSVIGPLITAYQNTAPLTYGVVELQGMTIYDALSGSLVALTLILPMLIARRCIASGENQRAFLQILTLAAMWYTVPMLMEIRLAPQLHSWIYGYASFGMGQQARYGWFRPVVFMQHGLWLAIFMAMATVASAAVWRYAPKPWGAQLAALLWLAFMLVMCRTVGALALALLFVPAAMLLARAPRAAILLSAAVAAVALLYPMLRTLDMVPTEAIISYVTEKDADRGRSIATRFVNEDVYLDHAANRSLAGWGGWNRWRVYDSETGDDLTVSDGLWVIIFGSWGWIGYVGLFGMLCAPVLIMVRHMGAPGLAPESGVLCLLLAMNLVDMLLNGSRTPITYMLCGALIGHAELLAAQAKVVPARLRGRPRSTEDVRAATSANGDETAVADALAAPGRRAGRGAAVDPRPRSGASPDRGPAAPRLGPIRPIKPRWGGDDDPRD
jgi:hypothetical protein